MKRNNTKFTPLETILNVYDENRVWYYLPGFNGYEISNDYIIRSMKHFKKYPYGLLIKPKKDGLDPIYELSDNQNERIQLPISEIMNIALTNPWRVTGYPRKTYMLDNASRNQRCTIKKKPIDKFPDRNEIYHYSFTIIQDEEPINDNNRGMIPICPIEFIR